LPKPLKKASARLSSPALERAALGRARKLLKTKRQDGRASFGLNSVPAITSILPSRPFAKAIAAVRAPLPTSIQKRTDK